MRTRHYITCGTHATDMASRAITRHISHRTLTISITSGTMARRTTCSTLTIGTTSGTKTLWITCGTITISIISDVTTRYITCSAHTIGITTTAAANKPHRTNPTSTPIGHRTAHNPKQTHRRRGKGLDRTYGPPRETPRPPEPQASSNHTLQANQTALTHETHTPMDK